VFTSLVAVLKMLLLIQHKIKMVIYQAELNKCCTEILHFLLMLINETSGAQRRTILDQTVPFPSRRTLVGGDLISRFKLKRFMRNKLCVI